LFGDYKGVRGDPNSEERRRVLETQTTKQQIRMVAGFAEVIDRKEVLVAGGGFEPPTFGLGDAASPFDKSRTVPSYPRRPDCLVAGVPIPERGTVFSTGNVELVVCLSVEYHLQTELSFECKTKS
jgi:hypothetical protein